MPPISDNAQIKEIQECLALEAVDSEHDVPPIDGDEPEVVLSSSKPLTLADVFGSLPPRLVADRLLSIHFNAKYLHIRTYWSSHWRDFSLQY
jgi:hypothetical protein